MSLNDPDGGESRASAQVHRDPPSTGFARTTVVIGVLTLGLALRGYLLAQETPLWGDEAMLAVGVLRAGFGDLLQPLPYLQVAPPLYLALVKLSVLVLGPAESVLRLPSFLAGALALFLMSRVACTIGGIRLALTVTMLGSLSTFLLRYSAELKPYAFDALFGAAIPYLLIRLSAADCRAPRRVFAGWLAAMTIGSVAAPVLVGGLVATVASSPELRRRIGWRTLVAAPVVAALVYLVLYVGLYHVNASSAPMAGFWVESQIAITRPGALVRFVTAMQQLGSLLPSFAPLAREFRIVLVVAGGVLLLPRLRGLRTALAVPVALALAFSAVSLFPIASRLLLFALPSLLLCLAQILVTLVASAPPERRRAHFVLAVLAIASISGLRMMPQLTAMSQLLIVCLIAVLVAPRCSPPMRTLLTACVAALIATPQAIVELRHPVIEDGRATITALLSARPAAIYIPAGSAPAWVYYSSDWRVADTARVNWYVAQARLGGPSLAFSGDSLGHVQAVAGVRQSTGRVEILGALGVVYRMPRGYISGPRPDWAASEAARINAVTRATLVVIDTHPAPGAGEALSAALAATGWSVDSTRRELTASATFMSRTMIGHPD
jgi:hypothetical protein